MVVYPEVPVQVEVKVVSETVVGFNDNHSVDATRRSRSPVMVYSEAPVPVRVRVVSRSWQLWTIITVFHQVSSDSVLEVPAPVRVKVYLRRWLA